MDLYAKNATVNEDVKRNIPSLRISEDLFDDLYDDNDYKAVAIAAESRVKQDCAPDFIQRGFHYTTSVLFPFDSENYQRTRYSDGSFGCWYGSMELDTTIYETAFHNLKNELNVEGIKEVIIRERAIYNIFCEGILLDFRELQNHFPKLIHDDYSYTQQIGRHLATQGHPGLLAPSARKPGGVNVVVFNSQILSNPRVSQYLTYYIDPINQTVRVEKKPNELYLMIKPFTQTA
ncbi:RES domain-containing protein [Candidatus Berkiella aquae]|uniref:RES domain protein n=1 Tax=Candidatus Berkiella aquae TaxID=295108 RepID=A0A0Q9YNE9_9GAMM|nr:RES family NAD+ phosphorylase [Candidatus Berkiella aquae]MCS5710141.1 RES family NAD+ phosphorylase [Candidatus Berkiella aquae]